MDLNENEAQIYDKLSLRTNIDYTVSLNRMKLSKRDQTFASFFWDQILILV
jgi:hypothetical protein